jgi:hypothetical protein
MNRPFNSFNGIIGCCGEKNPAETLSLNCRTIPGRRKIFVDFRAPHRIYCSASQNKTFFGNPVCRKITRELQCPTNYRVFSLRFSRELKKLFSRAAAPGFPWNINRKP